MSWSESWAVSRISFSMTSFFSWTMSWTRSWAKSWLGVGFCASQKRPGSQCSERGIQRNMLCTEMKEGQEYVPLMWSTAPRVPGCASRASTGRHVPVRSCSFSFRRGSLPTLRQGDSARPMLRAEMKEGQNSVFLTCLMTPRVPGCVARVFDHLERTRVGFCACAKQRPCSLWNEMGLEVHLLPVEGFDTMGCDKMPARGTRMWHRSHRKKVLAATGLDRAFSHRHLSHAGVLHRQLDLLLLHSGDLLLLHIGDLLLL